MGFERTNHSDNSLGRSVHRTENQGRKPSRKRGRINALTVAVGILVGIALFLWIMVGKILNDNPFSQGIKLGRDVVTSVTDSLECRQRLIDQGNTIIAMEEKETMELALERQTRELNAKAEAIENYRTSIAKMSAEINELNTSTDCAMGTPEEWNEWLNQLQH